MVKSSFGKSFDDKSYKKSQTSPYKMESKDTEVVLEAKESDEDDNTKRLKNYTMGLKKDISDDDIEENKKKFNRHYSDKDINIDAL